ncbi:putative methyltransferase [Helianthus annuus]|nr:putative methyltransferase [Helianthus annuus]KAJ0707860.1 putative methyltransferase [Helianthus annuus]KAJ0711837.1 putative methyltransferase [Helianthus annuus]KAJ0888728.1 putative methyltransferase [Helianthus annuus]
MYVCIIVYTCRNRFIIFVTIDVWQRKVISMTKPIIDDALADLYSAMNFPKTLIMADHGCSSGPNTLLVASELVKSVDKIRQKFGNDESPEIQIYLNDLPHNDFNTIFLSV